MVTLRNKNSHRRRPVSSCQQLLLKFTSSTTTTTSPWRKCIFIMSTVLIVIVTIKSQVTILDLAATTITTTELGAEGETVSTTQQRQQQTLDYVDVDFDDDVDMQNMIEMNEWKTNFIMKCQDIISRSNHGMFTSSLIDEKLQIENDAITKLLYYGQGQKASSHQQPRPIYYKQPQYCDVTFIDLGTNRGDSIAYAIDSTIDLCTPLMIQEENKYDIKGAKNGTTSIKYQYRTNSSFPHPRLNINILKPPPPPEQQQDLPPQPQNPPHHMQEYSIQTTGSRPIGLMRLLQHQQQLQQQQQEQQRQKQSSTLKGGTTAATTNNNNNMCIYGVEGNPYFTTALKELQDFVYNKLHPRPVQHLHIFTETVITNIDGPTQLYIDQYSKKNHFWGSSLLSSMPDVRKTANNNEDGIPVLANVTGISLSTMIRNIYGQLNMSNPLLVKQKDYWEQRRRQRGGDGVATSSGGVGGDDTTTANSSPSARLIIKMDVEGAEYSILKEVANSKVLCRYKQQLNLHVILSVEIHASKIKDPIEKSTAIDGYNKAKSKLEACGIQFMKLPAFWTN